MIRQVGEKIATGLPDFIKDIVGVGAVVLISYGSWLIYEPAGFIVGGSLVLAGVLFSSNKRS